MSLLTCPLSSGKLRGFSELWVGKGVVVEEREMGNRRVGHSWECLRVLLSEFFSVLTSAISGIYFNFIIREDDEKIILASNTYILKAKKWIICSNLQ